MVDCSGGPPPQLHGKRDVHDERQMIVVAGNLRDGRIGDLGDDLGVSRPRRDGGGMVLPPRTPAVAGRQVPLT
jgi:hypothetical protein